MKKLTILVWMILFLSPMVWAQERCEAPVWNVGDKWNYKDAAGETWTNEVVDSEKDLYILKRGIQTKDSIASTPAGFVSFASANIMRDTQMGFPQYLYAFDKKTLNIKYVVREGGWREKCTSPLREFFNFPIFVGKKWTESTNGIAPGGIDYSLFYTFKIEGIEDVSTAAGTFNAYRISCKFQIYVLGKWYNTLNLFDGETGFGWYRFWYSPEVKTWIKRKSQTGQWWGDRVSYWYKDAELISYELK